MLHRAQEGFASQLLRFAFHPCFNRLAPRSNSSRCAGGSPVDFLRHEALVDVAVSTHGDKLAHSAPACGIALAVENKIHCLSGL